MAAQSGPSSRRGVLLVIAVGYFALSLVFLLGTMATSSWWLWVLGGGWALLGTYWLWRWFKSTPHA